MYNYLKHANELVTFSYRPGNQFELLIDGENFFPRMLQCINEAKSFILFEQYLVESGAITRQFVEALCAAAERGVQVNLLFDDFGARALLEHDRKRLQECQCQLHFYNPFRIKRKSGNLFRNHRKLLVIDKRYAFIGGAGLTDDFSLPNGHTPPWHEVMLEIRGPNIVDWISVFSQTWDHGTGIKLTLPATRSHAHVGTQSGQVLLSSGPMRQDINRAVFKQIKRAKHYVWLTSPYFVTTWKIRRNLRRAARHGVDVRLLFPGPISDHPWVSFAIRRYYKRMLRQGVRIFEYQPRFIHAKITLCDDWVSIGSSNLDRWNQHWNLDANQAVHNEDFARQVKHLFESDFIESNEITYQDWLHRPRLDRIREWFSSRIVGLLELLIRYLR